MPGQPLKPIKKGLSRTWAQLSVGQRRTLVILVSSNLLLIMALLTLLLRSPAPLDQRPTAVPLSPQRLAACREQISRALLEAGYTGLVQTEPDGTIWLQLQWPRASVLRQAPLALTARASEDDTLWQAQAASPSNPPVVSPSNPPEANRSRLDTDAAVWAALEIAARASREGCLGFQVLQITVRLPETCATTDPASSKSANGCQAQHATARVRLTDLLMWSMDELDDAALSLRVDYVPPSPPLTPTPNDQMDAD